MGRNRSMDEWAHFEQQPDAGRVPSSSYWYVHCRHCAAAYAQKQLVNPPALITGRRTSMRAHLKVCPIYATRYLAEQRERDAAQHAQVAAAGSSTTTNDTSDGNISNVNGDSTSLDKANVGSATRENKRKRRTDGTGSSSGRGKHCLLDEWVHFLRLEDAGYLGKTNFYPAVCRHCQEAYDNAVAAATTTTDSPQASVAVPLVPPERIVGRREKLRKHLERCPHFTGTLPPLEPRGIVVPGGRRLTTTGATPAQPSDGNSSSTSNSNTRLALDEWQFFTRLARPPGSAYNAARCNFCYAAFTNAPAALQATMGVATVVGRKTNMQTHLHKCPHVPHDLLWTSSSTSKTAAAIAPPAAAAGVNSMMEQQATTTTTNATTTRFHVARSPPTPALALTDTQALDAALLAFTVDHNLPFDWLSHHSTQALFGVALTPSVRAIVPSPEALRSTVLSQTYADVARTQLEALKATTTTSADSTSDSPLTLHVSVVPSVSASPAPVLHCELSNGVTRVPVAPLLQRSAAESSITPVEILPIAFAHGLELARWLDAMLQRLRDVALVPSVVLVPATAAFQRAVSLLEQRWPLVVFILDVRALLQFGLWRALHAPDVVAVVAAVAELWIADTASGFDAAVDHAEPFATFETFAALLEWLVDDDDAAPCRTNSALHSRVDAVVPRALLQRVARLFCAFRAADVRANDSSRTPEPPLALAATLRHIGALYRAADGFPDVRNALEAAWHVLEQPLFVLAHALDPRERLDGIARSSSLTKFSKLSDLGVLYYRVCTRKRHATPLRGQVTAYLHRSTSVFAASIVEEFPVLDDYVRYLSDDYAPLATLMTLLRALTCALDVTTVATAAVKCEEKGKSAAEMEERIKVAYIVAHSERPQQAIGDRVVEGTTTTAAVDGDEHGRLQQQSTAMSATTVLTTWRDAVVAAATARGAAFAWLEERVAAASSAADGTKQTTHDTMETTEGGNGDATVALPPLPQLAVDDVVAFPSTQRLRNERNVTLTLRELFATVDANTI